MTKLSIIIPVYNEEATILKILSLIKAVDLPLTKEIIIVDDKSTDRTREILATLNDSDCRVILQAVNGGKGSAVRAGLAQASGELILIQDADLEYSPAEYPRLLAPILAGQADVVYGSRFIGGESKRVLFFWHSLGNKVLTNLSNMFTNLNLTDMETCYKVMTKEVLSGILPKLSAQRFGIEPELTALFARGPWRIYEVGITYNGRTYAEGKKINWRDGLAAFWHIIKFNLFR
jgi:glycosyltransferase involved in cell wall biosynthesis